MKLFRTQWRRLPAFTLIELLVVIAVIAILAALLIPVVGALKVRRARSVAQAELLQLVTMIDAYKQKKGFYPPHHGSNVNWSPLYFELAGTIVTTNGFYETLDGVARVSSNDFQRAFGLQGVANSGRQGGSDDESGPVSFLSNLRPTQVGDIRTNDPGIKILICSEEWTGARIIPDDPAISGDLWERSSALLNPWRYNSVNPTNNPNSYDLWIDIMIGGETNRISNWSRTPQIFK